MKKIILLILRWLTAIILVQTLYFKFTGAPESIYIFSTLGIEPWGRWFSGISEAIASLLLVVPATQIFGAAMALGIITGALASHLFILGIEIQGDGGLLFALACVVFLASAAILFLKRFEIQALLVQFKLLPQPGLKG